MIELPKPKCGHAGCAPQHCRFETEDYVEDAYEPSDGLSPEDRERRVEWERTR